MSPLLEDVTNAGMFSPRTGTLNPPQLAAKQAALRLVEIFHADPATPASPEMIEIAAVLMKAMKVNRDGKPLVGVNGSGFLWVESQLLSFSAPTEQLRVLRLAIEMGNAAMKGTQKNKLQIAREVELEALLAALGIGHVPPTEEEIVEEKIKAERRQHRFDSKKRRQARDRAEIAEALAAADAAGLTTLSKQYHNATLCGTCVVDEAVKDGDGEVTEKRIDWERIPAALRPSFAEKESSRSRITDGVDRVTRKQWQLEVRSKHTCIHAFPLFTQRM